MSISTFLYHTKTLKQCSAMNSFFDRIIRRIASSCAVKPLWLCNCGEIPNDYAPDLVLHHMAWPTLHYYIFSRYSKYKLINTAATPPLKRHLLNVTNILIVRHASKNWLHFLHDFSNSSHNIQFLFDDDIQNVIYDSNIPLKYATKTNRRFSEINRHLNNLYPQAIVSNHILAQKYNLSPNNILPPVPNIIDIPNDAYKENDDTCIIFYHGTYSHIREIKWLYNIIKFTLSNLGNCFFEISGGEKVYNLFNDIRNVRFIKPMDWFSYLSYTIKFRFDIGLAPLLDSPFNTSRTYTKFFDITRSGAVGIYSECSAYDTIIKHEHNGLLVPNTESAWIDAINRLALDSELRNRLYNNALSTMKALVVKMP